MRTRAEVESLPIPQNIAQVVEDAARRHGDKVAWSFFEQDEEWTFQQVRDATYRTASALLEAGVGRGDRVAVMLPNGAAYLCTWLGLGLIGAAIVPLNGRYTPSEVAVVLRTSTPRMFIVNRDRHDVASSPEVTEAVGRVIPDQGGVDSWSALVATASGAPELPPDVGALDLMNIQFTSGTTGLPKGCILPQRYWLNIALTWGAYTRPLGISRALVNQMLFYLDGQFNAIFALHAGATLYCSNRPSASKFVGWLREHHIDHVFYFDPLFKVAPTPMDSDNDLKIIDIFGFRPALHAELERRYGAIARESYGMTEFAPSLIMPLDADEMVGSGSCGLVAPFCEVRLVQEDGKTAAAPGTEGELVVRSEAQMFGYYGNPEATSATIKDGWIHTGDLFRQDDEGFFYLVGRKKDMVRRNSENIACAEVEAVLRLYPQVKEVAVIAVPDTWVGEEVKAYVQLREGLDPGSFDPRALLAMAQQHLASFKIPRYVQVHTGFTMTESSRVEKSRLVSGVEDLTAGSFDRTIDAWIEP